MVMRRRIIDYEVLEENGKVFIQLIFQERNSIRLIRAKMEKIEKEKSLSVPCIARVEIDDPKV